MSLKALLLSAAIGACSLPSWAFPIANFQSKQVSSNQVSVTFGIADADVGRTGNIYIGGSYGDVIIFQTSPTTWTYWTAGPLPVYSTGPLVDQTITIPVIGNVSMYVGYGLNEADMLNNHKYGQVFPVP